MAGKNITTVKQTYFSRRLRLKSWQMWGVICLCSFILTTVLLSGVFAGSKAAGASSPNSSTQDDWTTFMGDPGHSGYNASETTITPGTAQNLVLHWKSKAYKISSQPIVVNGVVYWGSWDGNEHAMTFSGTRLWTTNLGQTLGKCFPPKAGVTGSPTYTTIQVNGNPTPVLLLAGANSTFYALNAATGSIIWQTQLSTSPDSFAWGSPVVYNGSVYIGTSSYGDCPLTASQLFQMDVTTGTIQNTFNVVPQGCLGGGIWGTPTIDTSTGELYVVTGNNGTCASPEPYTFAIVGLQSSDLSVIDSWRIPASQRIGDSDFGNTPTLFQATINSVQQNMVGIANKNGIYYTFLRGSLSSGPVWTATLAISGSCPQCGAGSISASAWDGTYLYAAGGKTTINGTSCAGSLRALDPATGNFIWQTCLMQGPVLGAVTVIPNIAVVTQGNTVSLIATASGQILNNLVDTTTFSRYYASATISNGMLFVGNQNGKFFAYGL